VRGYGGDGALAKDALISAPEQLAFDSGDLYFVDNGNNRIRKVDAGGIISTVAGGGAVPTGCSNTSNTPTMPPAGTTAYNCFGDDYFASSAVLISPRGILKQGSTLYISEFEPSTAATQIFRGSRIRKVNLQTNTITTIAGSTDYRGPTNGFMGDTGLATSALLFQPIGMTLDANGDLVFADFGNRRLRKINLVSSPVGNINTIGGNGTASSNGNGSQVGSATFRRPWSLVTDSAGNIYVSDQEANNVRRIDPMGVVSPVAGTQGCATCAQGFTGDGAAARDSTLSAPLALGLAPNGALYICDSFNERVRAIGP
jgi:sugar lactone lactonase YvrE